jgi:uncharacterized protein YndB with AHSA1/START domain
MNERVHMPSNRTRSVDRQFFVRASPRKVFEAISTPRGLASWMVLRADVSPKTGTRYELEFDGGWLHRGSVKGFRAGRSVALTWAWDGIPVKGTVLTLSVRPMKGGSLLRLVHRGFPRGEKWTDLYGGAEWGWTYYGMNLKSVLETGHDLRSKNDG